jgi:hypothetical protein
VYIPPLIMSAVAELRISLNSAGNIERSRLPIWARVSEIDDRYRTHQWAKKTDMKLIPVPAATPTPHVLRIPAREKVVKLPSAPPPLAGPSTRPVAKRSAPGSPSPPRKAAKRPKAATRPVVVLRVPKLPAGLSEKGGKSKEILADTGSEKADEEKEAVKQRGKSKGKSVQTPAKVSLSFFDFTHSC